MVLNEFVDISIDSCSVKNERRRRGVVMDKKKMSNLARVWVVAMIAAIIVGILWK